MKRIKLLYIYPVYLIVSVAILTWLVKGKVLTESRHNTIKHIEEENYPVWIDMLEEENIKLDDARSAFESYWVENKHYRGDRSKQFEQWYAINKKRLNTEGKVISARQVASELNKIRSLVNKSQEGYWYNYGPVNVGPRNGSKRDGGRVKDVEFHPEQDSTFYVSTFKGGLFKSSDYGSTWTPLTDMLIEQVYVAEISNTYPDSITIGTDLGVYQSADGGQTWDASSSFSDRTMALLIHPEKSGVIIAGNETGIFRTDNGGQTWSLVQSVQKVEDLDVHPENPSIMYASTNGSPSRFYRSEDEGRTWQMIDEFGQGCFIKTAVTPAAPDRVYLINARDHLGDDSFEGFYVSEDAGKTFYKRSGQMPCITGYSNTGEISRGQPNYNLFVCVDPENPNLIYAGGVKSWKSTDGGYTWTHFFEDITSDGDNLHVDQLNWAFSPHDSVIFAVNDGGVYYLDDNNIFNMITDGMPIAEIYECSQSQTVQSNVIGGTMHCGIKLNKDGIWYTPWGGDEATCIIDPTDENYIYHLKYEKISRSLDGGMSFQNIYSENTDRGYYTGTGALMNGDPETLFIGLTQVHKTNNARAASVIWNKISAFPGSEMIQKLEICAGNNNILYVARGNNFYRSDNLNAADPGFNDLTGSLPFNGQITDIATDQNSENDLYILLGSKIFFSPDKGMSWTDITLNLPSVALLEMIFDKSSDKGIYVGTDFGVFYKDAGMNEWIDFSKNLPAIRVSGMDIFYGSDRKNSLISISTDGRGFWRSTLYGITPEPPLADFSSDRTEVIEGGSVKYTPRESQLTNYSWWFEGGTPEYSKDNSPAIKYSQPGIYSVKVEVSNPAGSDMIFKDGYITVLEESQGGTLQAHCTFEGTFDDNSPYNRSVSNNGGVTIVSDTIAYFSGNSFLAIPGYKGVTGSDDRSILAWIKTSVPGNSIASWGTATTSKKINFRTEATGELRFEIGGGYIIGTKKICDGNWHHVAASFSNDGSPNVEDVKLYVDGELDQLTTVAAVEIMTDEGDDVEIGNDQLSRKFKGYMDDFRIYNESLSKEQIIDIMGSVPTSIARVEEIEGLNIFSTRGTIQVENQTDEVLELNLFNLYGIKLLEQSAYPGLTRIDLHTGLYIISCSIKNSFLTEKIFVR